MLWQKKFLGNACAARVSLFPHFEKSFITEKTEFEFESNRRLAFREYHRSNHLWLFTIRYKALVVKLVWDYHNMVWQLEPQTQKGGDNMMAFIGLSSATRPGRGGLISNHQQTLQCTACQEHAHYRCQSF